MICFRHPLPARVAAGLEPAAKGGVQRLRDDPAARPPRPRRLLHQGKWADLNFPPFSGKVTYVHCKRFLAT